MFAMEIVRLIERCRQGDAEALGELYEAYAHRMRGVCRRYINDKQTVEDVVHDAFVIIFTSFDRLRDPQRAESWMMAIVRSLGCYPCRMAEPEMREVYDKMQGKLEIIGINQDKFSAWQEDDFSKSIVWKNWNDGKMGKADVENHYCDMKAIPYYVLISPDKHILWNGATSSPCCLPLLQ